MPSLRSVVYVSDATCKLSEDDLALLLQTARAENFRNGISGLLLYSDGNFMQCFEGPEEAVQETYARIAASRQHYNLFELMNECVDRRSFEGWDMALAKSDRQEVLALSSARWKSRTGPTEAEHADSDGWTLLQAFWKNSRR